jgi:FemAB-related protein (PEP-CTERM system-associated)
MHSGHGEPLAVAAAEAIGIDAERWDQFVESTPGGTVSHLHGWGQIIARTYGHRTHYLVAHRHGEPAGVLPLTEVRSRLFGSSLVSMPYLDSGGILTADPGVWTPLLRAARELGRDLGIARLDLRSPTRPPLAVPVRRDRVTLVLELPPDTETLWKSIGAKTRNQVRKAEKSGLAFETATAGCVRDFYQVYAANMRNLGSPPHARAWFETIFEVFEGRASCHQVRLGARVVGGLIALQCAHQWTVPWASSDRRYFKLCPNNLLYWGTLGAAIEGSIGRFDFGRSAPDSGTYRFKRQWGASEQALHWHEVDAYGADEYSPLAAGEEPARLSTTDTAAVRHRHHLETAWKWLPVPLATWLGSRLRGGITL